MTGNHLLLYRLAELMLEHEQHILPVDLLFDDEQIGDFVKSIQIDSPYQQMLLEGVLTESVREEKLYVTFTNEGYFHFVLGEVINYRTDGSGAVALKLIAEENKLNGVKEGVEQCLILQIEKGINDVLFEMIDIGDSIINHCVIPMSFLILKVSDDNYEFNSTENIEKSSMKMLLISLLAKSKESDYVVLFKSIKYLKQVQKNKCLRELYATILSFENYDSPNYLKILLDGAPFLDKNLKIKFLESAEILIHKVRENEDYPLFLSELATQYVILKNFSKAIVLFEESVSVLKSYEGDQREKFAKVYSNLGAAHWYTGNFEPMRECYERAYEIYLDLCGEFHSSTALALHNLALIKVMEEDYAESLIKFQKSLDITLRICGNGHPDTARAYSNMGSAYLKLSEHRRAFDLFNLALTIDKQVFHPFHPNLGLDYDDLGDALYHNGELSKAREHYEVSRAIFLKNYGAEYPHVKLLDQKLKQLNDL